MRLSIRLLGLDLLDVELSTDASSPAPDDTPRDDRGDCTTYPVGFVSRMDKPHEVDLPEWR